MENKPQGMFTAISLIAAFLLVIAVFVGVTVACKYLLAQYIGRDDLRTAVSFLIAAAVTLVILHTLRRLLKGN
jgi:hypothetical protein